MSKLTNPEAYNQRDVLTLKPLTQWTAQEERQHLKHNRVLQPGFSTRPNDLIKDAKTVGEEWITDIIVPNVPTAITLHLAKEMVVNYRVGEEDFNQVNHEVYSKIIEKHPDILNKLTTNINSALEQKMQQGGDLNPNKVEELANKRIENNNVNLRRNGLSPIEITPEVLEAAKRIIIDIETKEITNSHVNKFVKENIQEIAIDLSLTPKDVHPIGQSKDFSFLGAAGSGKSTIAKQWLSDDDKKNYVILATDNYRAFTNPGTEAHETMDTKDVFTRTQDSAYMIKELVQEAVNTQISEDHARPNIIVDAVTLEPSMKKLLVQGETISAIAAYNGTGGYSGIIERADARARDVNAAPADKGRFVNTSSLLEGHANASGRMLTSVPDAISTTLYNTNVERGTPAIAIGIIDNKNHIVEIKDLRVVSEFLNKKNINAEAENQIGLIYNSNNPLNILSTHPENKAKAILDLIPQTPRKAAYTIKLEDKDGTEYAQLIPSNNSIKLVISDETIFMEKANGDNIESSVLRALTRQIQEGSLENSLKAVFNKGDKASYIDSAKSLNIITPSAQIIDKKQNFKLNAQDTQALNKIQEQFKLNNKVSKPVIKQKPVMQPQPTTRGTTR